MKFLMYILIIKKVSLKDLKLRIDNGYADLFLEVKDGNYIHCEF